MIDREKVLAVLRKRIPDAPPAETAAAANAILGLDEEWQEVVPFEAAVERLVRSTDRHDPYSVANRLRHPGRFRLFEYVHGPR